MREDIFVILVDENDNPVGVMEKMEAHRKALLHRAISVFIVNSEGEWILQKMSLQNMNLIMCFSGSAIATL